MAGSTPSPRPSERLEILPRTGWTAPLTTLIAAGMAFLGVLTVAASFAAGNLADAWRSDLAGVATVRISALDGNVDDRVKSVLQVLRTTPGITSARPLSDEEQAALVAPWLAGGDALSDLPAPRLIDVTLEGDGPDARALQERLNLTVDGAVWDDHGAWRGPLIAAANALERVALVATFLVLATSIGMVAFAARATLIANQTVIRTVRLIGAEDAFLIGTYVRAMTLRAAIGGAAGAALGCLILVLLPGVDAESGPGAGLGAALSPGWLGWIIMALGVPVLGAGAAWITARWAVLAVLKRMP